MGLENSREPGGRGGPVGAFELLLDILVAHPLLPEGVTFDGQAYVSRLETVHAGGSGSSVENHDRK